jgi:hypothetical protein
MRRRGFRWWMGCLRFRTPVAENFWSNGKSDRWALPIFFGQCTPHGKPGQVGHLGAPVRFPPSFTTTKTP